jgi:hypothetical protein
MKRIVLAGVVALALLGLTQERASASGFGGGGCWITFSCNWGKGGCGGPCYGPGGYPPPVMYQAWPGGYGPGGYGPGCYGPDCGGGFGGYPMGGDYGGGYPDTPVYGY